MEISVMTKKSKLFTWLNLIFSSILWGMGILTLIFNVLGLWAPWHLAGFGFVFFIPVTLIFSLLSLLFSYKDSIIFIKFSKFASILWN